MRNPRRQLARWTALLSVWLLLAIASATGRAATGSPNEPHSLLGPSLASGPAAASRAEEEEDPPEVAEDVAHASAAGEAGHLQPLRLESHLATKRLRKPPRS
ncbi:MAG: hypothetical protein AMXMBFR34_18400 [Myxococcaceae bacterium]